MPVVNPGIRRFLGSAIQRLFNSAAYYAPLTHSAVPTRAASGTTGTFTRATTATVKDHEGVIRTVPSGCARFEGARFVRNLCQTSSEVMTSANGWTASNCAQVKNLTGPDGVANSAYTVTASAGNALFYNGAATIIAPSTAACFSVYLKRVTGTGTIQISADGANTLTTVTLTSDWTRFSVVKTGTGSFGVIKIVTNGDAIGVARWQIEDITGRTDQTTPSEYVSVGVESAPYYHGSMVDGVKCFATDLSGNPLTTMERYKSELAETNSTIQSNSFATAPWVDVSGAIPISQNVIGPDGAVSAWTFNDNGVGGFMGRYQEYSLTSGTAAAFGIFVKKTTGVQTNYPAIVVSSPTHMSGACLHRTNGTATAVTGFVGRTAIANTIVVEDFNTDYWRVKFTFTPNSTGAWGLYVMPAFNADGTGVGDNTITGTAVFYGMQGRVNGTMVGSYISTTTVAVTRNADVLTYSGGDIPNLKTLMAGFRREVGVGSSGVIAQLDDGTANDLVITYLSSATAIRHQGTDGGAVQWNLPVVAVSTYVPGTACKSVQTWTTNDVKAAVNGATLTGDTAATVPTVTQLTVGHQLGAWQLDGNVGPIYGWTRNFSQSELNAVTQ